MYLLIYYATTDVAFEPQEVARKKVAGLRQQAAILPWSKENTNAYISYILNHSPIINASNRFSKHLIVLHIFGFNCIFQIAYIKEHQARLGRITAV